MTHVGELCTVSDLSSYLDTAKGDRSIDAVVAKAKSAGLSIDRATVARYVGGQGAKNPPDSVLRALAAGLDLDVRNLRALAGKPRGELGPYVPVDEAARLNEEQRRAIDALIKSIVGAPAEVERAADKVERRRRTEPTIEQVRGAQLRAVADQGENDDTSEVERLARDERRQQKKGPKK